MYRENQYSYTVYKNHLLSMLVSRKVFHDLHLLITSTIWIMNGSYDSQILRCKNEQLRIFIETFLYENTRFLQIVDNSFFAYPSNDRRYFIIQRLKLFSCMHTLFCYVTSIMEMRSIRHSTMKSEWFVRESRRNS